MPSHIEFSLKTKFPKRLSGFMNSIDDNIKVNSSLKAKTYFNELLIGNKMLFLNNYNKAIIIAAQKPTTKQRLKQFKIRR